MLKVNESLPNSNRKVNDGWRTGLVFIFSVVFVVANLIYLYINLSSNSNQVTSEAETETSNISDIISRVNLPFGTLEGLQWTQNGKTVHEFLGIPFADPPLNHLRFKKPRAWTKSWDGIRKAKEFGFACLQLPWAEATKSSEDCLYLNVWTPLDPQTLSKERKPVYVNIFGGAFRFSSAANYKVHGRNLTYAIDTVVVTMNYRLGPLGYMYGGNEETPANVALYDQLLALEWVQKYVHLFGGNQDQVTIGGDSSGAMCTSIHVLSPLSQSYFNKAIIMSGVAFGYPLVMDKETALTQTNALSEAVGCGSIGSRSGLSLESVECLRRVDGHLLLQNFTPDIISLNPEPGSISFAPVYGDEFLPGNPLKLLLDGKHKKGGSIIIGTVTFEGNVVVAFGPEMDPKATPKETYMSGLTNFLKALGGNFSNAIDEASEVYFAGVPQNDEFEARKTYDEALGDLYFICPSNIFAEALSRHNQVFRYVMSYAPSSSATSIPYFVPSHGDDVGIFFGTTLISESDRVVSRKMQTEFGQFIKTGKTNWSPYFRTENGFLVNSYHDFNVSKSFTILDEYRSLGCNFWRRTVFTETMPLGNCAN